MTPASAESAFTQLAPPLQRWLWEQGWTGLRDAQLAALAPILAGQHDVVIAAATDSGKTEAAFLPVVPWHGEDWLARYVAAANSGGGIKRVLL